MLGTILRRDHGLIMHFFGKDVDLPIGRQQAPPTFDRRLHSETLYIKIGLGEV